MNLTNAASYIAEQHELFCNSLQGRYGMAQQPGKASNPYDIRREQAWAQRSRDALQARVSSDCREMVEALALTVPAAAANAMRARIDSFLGELNRILAEDVETLIRTMKVGRTGMGNMLVNGVGGAMGQLLQRKVARLEFRAPDSAGRKWEATRLVLFLAREMAYRIKLTKQIADLPQDLATVFNPDHDEDGMVFSAHGDTPGYPTFAELQDSVFHPNSTAEVSQHVAS